MLEAYFYICTFSFIQQIFIIENLLDTEVTYSAVVLLYIEVPASTKLMETECKYLLNECKIKAERPLTSVRIFI